jgi:hypothetical protein
MLNLKDMIFKMLFFVLAIILTAILSLGMAELASEVFPL